MTLKYNRIVNFDGRNGWFKQSGIEVNMWGDDNVVIWPTTSKGKSGRCEIQIPKEHLKQFIEQLETLL